MTTATVISFEYVKREDRYYINFKGGDPDFAIVKDYVKSFGSQFIKRHEFRLGGIGACWKVTASVLEQINPAFTNLEQVYEVECGKDWEAFLRRDEKALGIKWSAEGLQQREEAARVRWEEFAEEWVPNESYHNMKAKQASQKRSGRAQGTRHGYTRQREEPKREETFKQDFNDASKSAFDDWFQAEMDAMRRRQEEQEKANAERQRQREEAARQNIRESETFVRVELPRTPQEALNTLGLTSTWAYTLTKDDLKAAFNRQIKQYHPDLHRNDPEEVKQQCEIKIRQINAAYDLLSRYAA